MLTRLVIFVAPTLMLGLARISCAQEPYAPPSETLWNQMVQAADQISMPGPSNRQLMQLFQQVQRQAQLEASQEKMAHGTGKKAEEEKKPEKSGNK